MEEYDKLDCDARGLIRQLFGTSGAAAGVVTEDKSEAKSGGSGGGNNGETSTSSSSSPPRLTTTIAPSLAQSIILLESNAGYAQLHELLEQASNAAEEEEGRRKKEKEEATKKKEREKERRRTKKGDESNDKNDPASSSSSSSSVPSSTSSSSRESSKRPSADAARLAVPLETAARSLKDLVFARWVAQRCEPRADSARALAAIDHFLPFYPLERPHLERLLRRRLSARSLRAGGLDRTSRGAVPPRQNWGVIRASPGGPGLSSEHGSATACEFSFLSCWRCPSSCSV